MNLRLVQFVEKINLRVKISIFHILMVPLMKNNEKGYLHAITHTLGYILKKFKFIGQHNITHSPPLRNFTAI